MIDSRAARLAVLNMGASCPRALFDPSGSVTDSNRRHLLGLFISIRVYVVGQIVFYSREKKIFVGDDKLDNLVDVRTYEVPQGDPRTITADFTTTAENFDVPVEFVDWFVVEGTSVSLQSISSLNDGISTILIKAHDKKIGCSLIRARATFSDGQMASKYVKIHVVKP